MRASLLPRIFSLTIGIDMKYSVKKVKLGGQIIMMSGIVYIVGALQYTVVTDSGGRNNTIPLAGMETDQRRC